jgi:nicotinate phosphoribosyltransferase
VLTGRFAGTSNALFAMKLSLTPLGTMAHEYLQACQALGPRLRDSQVFGFETWAREYRGDLGIALSDVYGIEPFLRDFDMYFCKLFDGARHDSGDPFTWGERMIEHYKNNRVDPLTKTLIFSDGLTVPRTIELYQRFRGRCQLAFGIGTNLTNDLGYEPLANRHQNGANATDSRSPSCPTRPPKTCAKTPTTWPICAKCLISPNPPLKPWPIFVWFFCLLSL